MLGRMITYGLLRKIHVEKLFLACTAAVPDVVSYYLGCNFEHQL